MKEYQQRGLRRALSAVPKAELPDLVVNLVDRVGGHGALMAAIAEVQNTRAAQQARRRQSAQREVRA